jgi:hypothetical protein
MDDDDDDGGGDVNLPAYGSREPCRNSVAIGVLDPGPHTQLPQVNDLVLGVQMIIVSGTS